MHNFWPVTSHNSWEERIIQISNNLLLACLFLGFTVTKMSPSLSVCLLFKKEERRALQVIRLEETLSCLLLLHNTRVFHASSQQVLTWKCLKGYNYHSHSIWCHKTPTAVTKGNKVLCLCDLCFRFLRYTRQLKPATLLWIIKIR